MLPTMTKHNVNLLTPSLEHSVHINNGHIGVLDNAVGLGEAAYCLFPKQQVP